MKQLKNNLWIISVTAFAFIAVMFATTCSKHKEVVISNEPIVIEKPIDNRTKEEIINDLFKQQDSLVFLTKICDFYDFSVKNADSPESRDNLHRYTELAKEQYISLGTQMNEFNKRFKYYDMDDLADISRFNPIDTIPPFCYDNGFKLNGYDYPQSPEGDYHNIIYKF